MIYLVYAIKSPSGRIYVGQTQDFERRLNHHNTGRVISTRNESHWASVKYEEFTTRSEARYF